MFQQLWHESKVFSPLHRHHNHTFHVPNQPHSPFSHLSQRIAIHQLVVPSSYPLSPIEQQASIQHLTMLSWETQSIFSPFPKPLS
uniref:Uncharacterized protein n=1 Tax=Brassica oleracea TaxID=3712 RepID=A0A3P6C8H9_BRAOL|nr:unnamed protein product [Brassica oleracea]